MSQQTELRIACPHCKTKAKVKVYTSIDVTLEPKLRTQLFQQKINLFKCKKCEKESQLSSPLLYQDHQKDFMIQMASDQQNIDESVESGFEVLDAATQAEIVTRRVRTWADLLEKIVLLEAELDDRVIEILKLQIKEQQPELSIFPFMFAMATKEALRFYAITDKGPGRFDIPRENYKALAEALKELGLPAREPEQWRVVDAAFAAETKQRLDTPI